MNWFYLLVPVVLFLLVGETQRKPVKRKRRVSMSGSKVGVKRSVGVKNSKMSSGVPVMPKKYASGCKGKKGSELGTCLRWWRQYRSGKCKLPK